MKQLKSNQAGFGTAEAVMLVIVVLLLAVLGFLYYKRQHKTKTTVAPVASVIQVTTGA